jgi:hypothetical protein
MQQAGVVHLCLGAKPSLEQPSILVEENRRIVVMLAKVPPGMENLLRSQHRTHCMVQSAELKPVVSPKIVPRDERVNMCSDAADKRRPLAACRQTNQRIWVPAF